jgi:hypothetical protein
MISLSVQTLKAASQGLLLGTTDGSSIRVKNLFAVSHADFLMRPPLPPMVSARTVAHGFDRSVYGRLLTLLGMSRCVSRLTPRGPSPGATPVTKGVLGRTGVVDVLATSDCAVLQAV